MTETHTNRGDERGIVPPRSSRVFSLEGSWFFATREGTDIGPFHSRDEADSAIQDFVTFIQLATQNTKQRFLSTLCASYGTTIQ